MFEGITQLFRKSTAKPAPSEGVTASDVVIAGAVQPEPIHDLAALVKDMLTDGMAVMTMGVLLANIKRADVTIAVENSDTDATAEAIEDDLQRLWLETLEKLNDLRNGVLTWGGIPFEIASDNAIVDSVPLTRIREFKQLPKVIRGQKATELVLNPDGSFGGIRVMIDGEDFVIPPEESAWFAIGATPLEPYGQSVFIGAPQAQRKRRKATDQLIDTFVRKWALRGPVIHAPASAVDRHGNVVDNHEFVAKQLQAAESGAGMIFPNTPAGPGMDGKYAIDVTHEAGSLDSAPLEFVNNMMDANLSRSLGVHESVTMDTDTGSYASQTVRMFVVLSKCDGFVSQYTSQFSAIVNRVYRAKNNCGAITVTPISLITDGFLMELVKALILQPQWGPLLQSGAIDLATILANSGLPVSADAAERLDAAFEKVQEPPTVDPSAIEEDPASVKKKAELSSDSEPVQSSGVNLAVDLVAPLLINRPLHPRSDALPPFVPDSDELADETLRYLDLLYAEAIRLLTIGQPIGTVAEQLDTLVAQAEFASWIAGSAGLWQESHTPQLVTLEAGTHTPGVRFPWIEEATRWLMDRDIYSPHEIEKQARAEPGPRWKSLDTLTKIRDEIASGFAEGESFEQFHKRIKDQVNATKPELQNAFRTSTHQAYIFGATQTLEKPAVKRQFPYVLYYSAHDTRTRATHRPLDGLLFDVGSEAYRVAKAALADYNCRCRLVSQTARKAAEKKLKPVNVDDLPIEVLIKYRPLR